MARISFFIADLSSNPIGRAAPLVEALLDEGHEVEVIGFLISGPEVYAPYRSRFNYKTIRINGSMRSRFWDLAQLATGDLVYCCKPTVGTLLPALIASGFGKRKPLLLDVEDDELWIDTELLGQTGLRASLQKYWRLRYAYAIHPFTRLAKEVTVVSRQLQRRYGGTIILHGPNEMTFDVGRDDLRSGSCRERFALPAEVPLVLFVGIPHKHKGIPVLVEALGDPRLIDLNLILVGPPDHKAFVDAQKALPGRVRLLGYMSNTEMPALLTACNIVATPQLDCAFTQSQVPAKLLEAMAMGKSIVSSRVSDLPYILGENEESPRGWLHTPGDALDLANCLASILNDSKGSARRGNAARAWYLRNASMKAVKEKLRPVISRCLED